MRFKVRLFDYRNYYFEAHQRANLNDFPSIDKESFKIFLNFEIDLEYN